MENYQDLTYGDYQLRSKINQALQEYDSLAQKLTGTKNAFNNNFSYKTPSRYNNYKLKRNTPFISSKKRDYLYPTTFGGNFNNSKIFGSKNKNLETNDILEEFKETLEKSQIIKDDLLKMDYNLKSIKRHKKKKYDFLKKNKIKNLPLKYKENFFEEEKSSTSNGGTNLDYISNEKDTSESYHKIKSGRKKEKLSLKKSEKEKKKLENEAKVLINKYQEIKKENRILEIEIANYKKMANQYVNFGNNYKTKFNNKYSQKTINELEQSLQQNIQNNCLIVDTILKIQQNNEKLSSKLKNLSLKMNINLEKIEQKNRKNAEIQIINEENEQKVMNLQDDKQSLLHELESQKILY